jgi:carboxymethylenebutenolidase
VKDTKTADFIRENVTLEVTDGTSMNCYCTRPGVGECKGGILMLHGAFGTDDYIRSRNDRFSEAGYIVIAPDLFHRTRPGFEGNFLDYPTARPLVQAVIANDAGAEADLAAAFRWLDQQPGVEGRIASLGFCLGGRTAYLANAILPVRAGISLYGDIAPKSGEPGKGLLPRTPTLHAPMLLLWAGLDAHILPEHRAAVIEAMKTHSKTYVSVEFSDANHGYGYEPDYRNYHPHAARQSWALIMEFLKAYL